MTHDLLRNLLDGARRDARRAWSFATSASSTFYAYLELHRGGEVLFVDARPSDALALSLRTRAPVFVDTKVLDQARSVETSATEQADQERLQRWLESLDPDDLGYKM